MHSGWKILRLTMWMIKSIQNFTTQSLASVAYQVHTLASSMLNLLSEQDDELSKLTSGSITNFNKP